MISHHVDLPSTSRLTRARNVALDTFRIRCMGQRVENLEPRLMREPPTRSESCVTREPSCVSESLERSRTYSVERVTLIERTESIERVTRTYLKIAHCRRSDNIRNVRHGQGRRVGNRNYEARKGHENHGDCGSPWIAALGQHSRGKPSRSPFGAAMFRLLHDRSQAGKLDRRSRL
jgi:hypothetical protein